MSVKCVTPPTQGRSREMIGCSDTPVAAAGNKYYCPVCMLYFPEIRKSQCCSNYLCEFCEDDVTRGQCTTACPFCVVDGVKFVKVEASERIKIYKDSPAVVLATSTNFSPVQPGASFDDLKRKVTLLPEIPRDSKFDTLTLSSHSISGSSAQLSNAESIPTIGSVRSRGTYVDDSTCSCSGESAVCVIS